MDRKTLGFALFSGAAFVAIIAMMVSARTHHSRFAPSVATASAAGPADAPATHRPSAADGARGAPAARMQMAAGYRAGDASSYMRMCLRELTMAEEQAYNETGGYTSDMSKLMLARRTGDVVVLRVAFAGPAGWSGEATHPDMAGKSCVTYAGPVNLFPRVPETMTDRTRPLGERDVVCDKL